MFKRPGLAENALGARKAIHNWPRGKSTTAAWSNTRWEDAEADWTWAPMITPDFQLDLLYDKCYHLQQKQMIDRWAENYREGYFTHSLIFTNLR